MADLHPWPRPHRTIDFMQHVRAGTERVWRALTTESELQSWLGATHANMPQTVGEPFMLEWVTQGRVSGETTHGWYGRVHTVIPERLLALDFKLRFTDCTTQFSVQLQPSFMEYGFDRGAECDIWIIQSGFPTEGTGLFEYDGLLRHWRQSVDNLVAALEDRPAKGRPYAIAGMEFVGGARDQGVLVADVVIDGPADKAGIQPGDIIVAIDGRQLHAVDDFHDWVAAQRHGDSGTFEIAGRGEVTLTVESIEVALARFRIQQGDRWEALDGTILKEPVEHEGRVAR
jgi:uncharacterized protein YndB with AHSA1/START domain